MQAMDVKAKEIVGGSPPRDLLEYGSAVELSQRMTRALWVLSGTPSCSESAVYAAMCANADLALELRDLFAAETRPAASWERPVDRAGAAEHAEACLKALGEALRSLGERSELAEANACLAELEPAVRAVVQRHGPAPPS